MAQCRCPAADKTVLEGLCDACAATQASTAPILRTAAGLAGPRPVVEAGGSWHGTPVWVRLELEGENPMRYVGTLELGQRRSPVTVRYWHATEFPLWLVELAAPDPFDTPHDEGRIVVRAQKYEFQRALDELAAKLDAARAWVDALLPRSP
jgi:hypothetical protein